MKIIESEFDFIARKGAISRARKQAFKNLLTKGMRNYVQVVVWAKSGFEYYAVMVYVDKETSVMKMQEFKHNGPKRLNYKYSEVTIHRNDSRIPNEVRNWYQYD